jgi:hypothetical protein
MRSFLIILLIVLIVFLGGAWAYLLLNGAPESVADLREKLFGGGSGPVVSAPVTTPVIETEDTGPRTIPLSSPLIEVSNRAVAGAVITEMASSTVLRYMEEGTGHIYEVSLETGIETRISNTTIPGASRAIWAPQGSKVVVLTDTQGVPSAMFLGTLSTTTNGFAFDLEGLPEGLDNIAFSHAGTLFYTTEGAEGMVAWSRDPKQGSVTPLFTLPFREGSVLWDTWGGTEHYVFTKPAFGFQGFLYAIGKEGLEKIDEGATLAAVRPDTNILIINKNRDQGVPSLLLDRKSGLGSFLPLPVVEEKCTGTASMLWCASDATADAAFPVSWYQGTVSYDDLIYRIDAETGTATLELDPETLARKPLDVTDLATGPDGHIIFKNKTDDTLWLMKPAAGF